MKLWAVEGVLSYRDDHNGGFPAFADLANVIAELIPCSPADAEKNIWEALRREEIQAVFDDQADMRLIFGPNVLSGAPWLKARRESQ